MRTLRDLIALSKIQVLDLYSFRDLKEMSQVIDSWMADYNYGRHHESLNNFSPIGFSCNYNRSKLTVDLMDTAKALPTNPQLQIIKIIVVLKKFLCKISKRSF